MNWTPECVIPSYEDTLAGLRKARRVNRDRPKEERAHDESQLNSMVASTTEVLYWLTSGISPYDSGIQRMSCQHHEFTAEQDRLDHEMHELANQTRFSLEADPSLQCQVNKFLQCLSDKERSVFILVHGEGMTPSGAAVMLNKSVGQIRQHLFRARKKFSNLCQNKEIC